MITGFHHLVLFCAGTERSGVWFEEAGFEYVRGYSGVHWFKVGTGEIMLHPSAAGPQGNAPHIHFATGNVDAMFRQAVTCGLQPLDHQQPGVLMERPVTRPWGAREFELEYPDGQRIILTEARSDSRRMKPAVSPSVKQMTTRVQFRVG